MPREYDMADYESADIFRYLSQLMNYKRDLSVMAIIRMAEPGISLEHISDPRLAKALCWLRDHSAGKFNVGPRSHDEITELTELMSDTWWRTEQTFGQFLLGIAEEAGETVSVLSDEAIYVVLTERRDAEQRQLERAVAALAASS